MATAFDAPHVQEPALVSSSPFGASEPASSAGEAAAIRVVNAMTIDVEDYFHVSVFDGVVPRSEWARLESRVERNTDRFLAIFDEFGVPSTCTMSTDLKVERKSILK